MNNYQVGDVLRVRQWDDMAAEFGLDGLGGINCKYCKFAPEMRYMCGQTFTVSSITPNRKYHSKEGIEDFWLITEDMLEPYCDVELYADPTDKKNIEAFLSTFQTGSNARNEV